MRIAEYERLKLVANGLKSISTKSGFGFSKISGTTAGEYMAIAELNTGISSDKIEGIYPVATIDSTYIILVVYNGDNPIAYPVDTIIGCTRPFDVRVIFANDDIFTDLTALYKVMCKSMQPAPADDVFYMYCFFNAFRGIYTHDDVISVAKSQGMADDIPAIIEELIDSHNDRFIPDGPTIANAVLDYRKKLKNTVTETE